MDSFMETQFHTQHHQPNQQQQPPPNSGLLRFRSAPSSLFNDFTSDKIMARFGDDFSEPTYERKPHRLNLNSQNGYSGSGHLPPQYPKQNIVRRNSTSNSTEVDHDSGGGGLNLNRQSSSPAGFFNHLNPQNGYTVVRGLGSLRVGSGTNGELSPRTSRLSINHLPQIPEIGNEIIKETSPVGMKFRNDEDDSGFDTPTGFSFTSWKGSGSDASHLSENGGLSNRANVLSHHLSLPKTSAEMAAVEKLLHFQDMVPCKVRAKRGFATHPRSIAERVRRNRISERMRKLQDLVPNMDKQTNTADMLDLAVDHIKELQNQHRVLTDNRAKCKCGNVRHSAMN